MHDSDEMFLYEIIEDYKEAATQDEKDRILGSFCSLVWSSDNKRRLYKRSIRFKVGKELLHTELGQVFDLWSHVEYPNYKSMTKSGRWQDLIRQKANNIYTRYFDKEVILGKEYIDLLKTPKRLYYQWISGTQMDVAAAAEMIRLAMDASVTVKKRLQLEKMELSWQEYKKVTEGYFKRCFDNSKLIWEYEDHLKINTTLDFLTEDHFYVKYICRTLENYFRNYQKEYYHVRRGHGNIYTRCKQCGAMIEKTGNKRLYCKQCARKNNLERYQRYNQKRNHK